MRNWISLIIVVLLIFGLSYFIKRDTCEAKQCNLDWCYTSSNCGSSCFCVKKGRDLMGTCYLVD